MDKVDTNELYHCTLILYYIAQFSTNISTLNHVYHKKKKCFFFSSRNLEQIVIILRLITNYATNNLLYWLAF